MEQKALIVGENCINKDKFHIFEKSINTDKVDIKRMVLSNKESYSKKGSHKYLIGYIYIYIYKGNTLPSSSCIKFTQVNAFAKYFHKNNKCVDLLVNDKKILEKHNEIWNKIKNLFGKKLQ